MNWTKVTDQEPPKDGRRIFGARWNSTFNLWDIGVIIWNVDTFSVVPTKDFRLSLLPTHWAEIVEPTNTPKQ